MKNETFKRDFLCINCIKFLILQFKINFKLNIVNLQMLTFINMFSNWMYLDIKITCIDIVKNLKNYVNYYII